MTERGHRRELVMALMAIRHRRRTLRIYRRRLLIHRLGWR